MQTKTKRWLIAVGVLASFVAFVVVIIYLRGRKW
jgi:uncharacterized membrane protein